MASESGLDFRILGPVEVLWDGRRVEVGGPRQRALLALLLVYRNRVVASDRLIDLLWGERPPPTAENTLHVLVSNLRRALTSAGIEGVLVTRRPGYELRVAPGDVDLERFEALRDEASRAAERGDHEAARACLAKALEMWRDDPLAELMDVPELAGELARLRELRLVVLEERIDDDLAAGRHREVIAELEGLVGAEPLREHLRAQLMLALYRCGRQADALDVYRQGRRLLVDELGIDPGPELCELERAILTHDPALRAPVRPLGRRRPRSALIATAAAVALVVAALVVLRSGARAVHAAAPENAVVLVRSARVAVRVPLAAAQAVTVEPNGVAWLANTGSGTLATVSRSGAPQIVGVGGRPTDLAWGFGKVWVGDAPGRRLVAYDPTLRSVVLTVRLASRVGAVGQPAARVAVGAGSVWVDNGGSAGVSRINPANGRVTARISGVQTGAIAYGLGSAWVAGAYFSSARLDRIDPASDRRIASISLPSGAPVSIATAGHDVWVVCDDGSMWRVDPRSRSVAPVTVPGHPIAVTSAEGAVWVATTRPDALVRLNPDALAAVKTVRVEGAPQSLAGSSGSLWVSTAGPAPLLAGRLPGATVTVALNTGIDSIDPALSQWATVWQIEYATGLRLLTYPDASGPAGEHLIPDAAVALPRVSNHGRTYTFTIRRGLRFWPTRQPVTAAAFRAAVERALSPRVNSPFGRDFMADLVGASAYEGGRVTHIAGIRIHGRYTIAFTTSGRDPDFPTRIAMPFYTAVPPNTPDVPATRPIPTAGPYYVAAYAPGRQLVLRRNPGYPGPRHAAAAQIVYRLGGANSPPAWRQVAGGLADYDADPASPSQLARLRAAGMPTRVRVASTPAPELRYLVLNTHSPKLRDPRVRRAIADAIDRAALAATLGPNAATPTDQYLPPTDPGYPGSGLIYPLNRPQIHAARQLLNASGGRRPLTLRLSSCNDPTCRQDGAPARAELLRHELARIGIRLQIIAQPRPRQFALDTSGRGFDIADEGFDFPNPDPSMIEFPLTAEAGMRTTPAIRRQDHAPSPQRYAGWGELELALARGSSPLVAYAIRDNITLSSFQARCLVYQPEYGIDLTRLCRSAR